MEKWILNRQIDLQTVLVQRPLGLVFDIDGTLSPLAPTPDLARLYPGVVPLLERASKYVHVAIMTGRAIDDGAAMVNVDGLTYIGTHGLEWSDGLPWLHPVHVVPEALDYYEPGKYLLDLVEKQLSDLPGVIVQRKRIGGSIHYRLSPNPVETRQKLLSLLEQPARQVNMSLSEGKQVVEVRVPLPINKGQALRQFAQRFSLQAAVARGGYSGARSTRNGGPITRNGGNVRNGARVSPPLHTTPTMIRSGAWLSLDYSACARCRHPESRF